MSQESLAAPKYTMTRQCQVYLNSANLDTLAPSKLSASTHNNKPNPYRLRPAVWDDEFDDNSPREDQPYPMPPWRYESPPYGSSYDYRRLPVSTIEHSTPPSPETLPPRYKLRPWKSPTNPTYQAGIPPSATYESPYPPVFYSPMWNSPSSLSYIYRGLRPFEPPAQPSRVDEPPRPGPAQAEPTLGSTSSGDDLDPTLSNTDMLLQANVAQESPSMRPELISNEHRLNSDLFSDPLPIGSPEDNEQDETEEEKVLMDLLPIDDDAISRESSTSSRAGTSEYNPPRIRLIPPRPPPIILTPKKQDWPQIGSVLGKNHESTPTLTSLTNGAASGRSALSPSKYSTIELTVSQSERKESDLWGKHLSDLKVIGDTLAEEHRLSVRSRLIDRMAPCSNQKTVSKAAEGKQSRIASGRDSAQPREDHALAEVTSNNLLGVAMSTRSSSEKMGLPGQKTNQRVCRSGKRSQKSQTVPERKAGQNTSDDDAMLVD